MLLQGMPRRRCALGQLSLKGHILNRTAGHGKKKKKWQQGEPEEEAGSLVPAGPKKEVPKPYMSDAKFVTSEFRTTGKKLVKISTACENDETVAGMLTAKTE